MGIFPHQIWIGSVSPKRRDRPDLLPSGLPRPNKRSRVAEIEEEGLIGVVKSAGKEPADAIKIVTKPDDLRSDLFGMHVEEHVPGFNSTHISFYFAYLVANPRIGRAFYTLPWEHKLYWVTMSIAEKFPGQ